MQKKHFNLLFFLFIATFTFSLMASHQIHASHRWKGFSVRMQGGMYADYLTMKFKDGSTAPPTGVGNLFGWGMEYGFVIKNHFYLGVDLGFPYYERVYHAETKEDISRFAFPILAEVPHFVRYLVPVTYLHIGYAAENWLVTVGAAYIQGIVTTIRVPVTEHISVDFRHSWFLDRFINVGIHDMHFLFAMTYTF